MLENAEEKVNALTKLADLVGKKTLVMWCILTTFTTCYLFYDGRTTERQLNAIRIQELKESQSTLIKKMENMERQNKETKVEFNRTKDKLDTLVDKASQKLEDMK